MVRAAVYARISSDREGDGAGARRQVDDCEGLAAARGWTVVDRYVDDDISAWSGKHRPEYRRLVEDVRAGLIDAVVVWHLDRLHRHPRELEEFFEVVDKAGVSRLATVTGDIDLSKDDGRFHARILGAVARKESDDKSRRIRRKAAEIALSGRVGGGGTRPYGFEADRLTARESEAVVIRECVARFLAGEPVRAICGDLNARGVPTVTGGPWKSQVLIRVISAPRTSGQREHRGEIVGDAVWPAIVRPADTARIRAILADPARRTNRTARRYLLLRLLRCSRCDETLVSRPASGGVRRYICAKGTNYTGCGKTYIASETLEQFIVEAVLYRLDSPDLARVLAGATDDPDAERTQLELDEAQAHLDELARAYGERAIGLSEWLAARSPIEARLAAARKHLARLSRATVLDPYIGNVPALREAWTFLPLTRQRAIVAAVLDHAVIGPGRRGYNRFDSARVTPVWRV